MHSDDLHDLRPDVGDTAEVEDEGLQTVMLETVSKSLERGEQKSMGAGWGRGRGAHFSSTLRQQGTTWIDH